MNVAKKTENMPVFLRNNPRREWLATFQGSGEPVIATVLVSDPKDGRYGSWEEALDAAKMYAESCNVPPMVSLTMLVMSD